MKKLFLILPFTLLSVGGFAQLFKSKSQPSACNTTTTNLLLTSLVLNNLWEEDAPKPSPLNYHSGIAITNTNDTIEGNIRLDDNNNFNMIVKRKGLNIDTNLSVSDVKMIRLFATDSLLNNEGYTDYVRFDTRKYLLRQVYKGDFELYDDLYSSNEYPGKTGNYIVVKDKETTTVITGTLISNPRKNIIEYVNGRYSKNFTSKDFARVIDVINWIRLNG